MAAITPIITIFFGGGDTCTAGNFQFCSLDGDGDEIDLTVRFK